MTSRRPSRAFLLSDAEPAALLEAVEGRFGLAPDGHERVERVVLDTADRRLRRAGIELAFEPDERAPTGRLVLSEAGRPTLRAAAGSRDRYLARDLPPGPLAGRLAPVIDVRVLLPLVRLRIEERRWRLLDDERKTVVRIALSSARVMRERRRPVAISPRLELRPVLGYDRAAERLGSLLSGELGLSDASQSPVDDAILAIGGEPDGLVTRVQPSFGRDERADRATLAVLDALADVVEAGLPGTLDDLDPEFLHDVRVAVRRSRSVLRQMRGVLPQRERDRFRVELRWLQQLTGPVRDLDVHLLEWDELKAGLSPEMQADLDGAPSLLARRRAAALAAMRRQLRGKRFAKLWTDWRDFLRSELPEFHGDRPDAGKPVAVVTGRRIRREYRRIVEMGEAIDDTTPGEALHELRKHGKELRYLLELFGHLWPAKAVKPLVGVLKDLQDVLGRHQDAEVQAGALRTIADDLVAAGEPGATALALGVVVERLHREQARVRGEFAERFAAFAAAGQRGVVRRTFRGRA